MICPICASEGYPNRGVWSYDDAHVNCKRGHIQRVSNTVPYDWQPEPEPPPDRRPDLAIAMSGCALLFVVVDLLVSLI